MVSQKPKERRVQERASSQKYLMLLGKTSPLKVIRDLDKSSFNDMMWAESRLEGVGMLVGVQCFP